MNKYVRSIIVGIFTAVFVLAGMYLFGLSGAKSEAQDLVHKQQAACHAAEDELCRRSPKDCPPQGGLGLSGCDAVSPEGPEYNFKLGWPRVFASGNGDSLGRYVGFSWPGLFLDLVVWAVACSLGWFVILSVIKKRPSPPAAPPPAIK